MEDFIGLIIAIGVGLVVSGVRKIVGALRHGVPHGSTSTSSHTSARPQSRLRAAARPLHAGNFTAGSRHVVMPPAMPAVSEETLPIIEELPEEGGRITSDSPVILPPAAHPSAEVRALRNAVLWSEILKPKFDR